MKPHPVKGMVGKIVCVEWIDHIQRDQQTATPGTFPPIPLFTYGRLIHANLTKNGWLEILMQEDRTENRDNNSVFTAMISAVRSVTLLEAKGTWKPKPS